MHSQRLRQLFFSLHRYLGLAIGLLLAFIGITESLLVFEPEIDHWLTDRQFGQVIPQAQRLALEQLMTAAKVAYPNLKPVSLYFPDQPEQPFKLRMESSQANPKVYLDGNYEVFLNPYSGKVLGDRADYFPLMSQTLIRLNHKRCRLLLLLSI